MLYKERSALIHCPPRNRSVDSASLLNSSRSHFTNELEMWWNVSMYLSLRRGNKWPILVSTCRLLLTHIFRLVLSRILYKFKVSKLKNFNIGISKYATLERPNYKVPMILDSVCIYSIPATYFPS